MKFTWKDTVTVHFFEDHGLFVKPQDVSHFKDEELLELADWCNKREQEAEAISVIEYILSGSHNMLYQVADWIIEACAKGDLARKEVKTICHGEMLRRQCSWEIEHPAQIESKRRQTKPGFIYLAYCDTGHYKIGMSIGPEDRIEVFNTKMPVGITMIHTFPTDDMPITEARLHQIYADKRVKGEWFDLSPEDVETIKNISCYQKGDFA